MSKSASSSGRATKEQANAVNRDRILAERVRKEINQMTLHTDFAVNPYRPGHSIAGKPNSWQDAERYEAEEDPVLVEAIRKGNQVPLEKYTAPLTSSQEIGWMTTPLIEPLEFRDKRFNHARKMTGATKFQEEMWRFIRPQNSISFSHAKSSKNVAL